MGDQDDDELSMGEMTRKLAEEREPMQEGSSTIAWTPGGGAGMSQNDAPSTQAPDSAMAQQGHQPAQGTEGGHAAGTNHEQAAPQAESTDA